MTTPAVGDAAPDVSLLEVNGLQTPLSSLWSQAPTVLVFLRYFGCPFCQAQVVTLREDRERFSEAGATVTLIGQGSVDDASAFTEFHHVLFPLLLDPDRHAYRRYGLVDAGLMQVIGPRVAVPFLKANAHAETRQRGLRGGTFMQMPGSFVVDTGGIVRLAHRNRHVADNPRNDVILEVLRGIGASRSGSTPTPGPRADSDQGD